ncbi:hypothetical protein DTO013E5_3410 [Penicillium roqueforti]|nr:uncharacterized protein LCP9604111_6913 [Penicillium roqueforti]KAF9245595.1 hypothetical protein LCP9604111_6913 [Penicillium roqueforti]KAI1832997.1 hypothetical protein CBS147337_6408 [Penicillium roqueforti]KAI2689442.1 hypothetical protein LCP963914a_2531 [Penicillium roqueforti]KAI2696977.1 hypothetical protein CBS147372_8031 [Penicillium roqueforti]KAI2724519.1 hypothetical protein CBS147318_1450 [Penicillium roqueforti]
MVTSTPVSFALFKCPKTVMQLPSLPLRIRPSHLFRPFHSSVAVAKTPDVFANSLRKTLEAHRSTNRSRLIRKIYPVEDPAGLWRPEIPSKSRADYQPTVEPALPDSEYSPDTPDPGSKRRQKKRASLVDIPSHQSLISQRGEDAIQPAGTGRPAQSPWLTNLELSRANAEITLDAEIRALHQYLSLRARERDRVEKLRTEVASLLKTVVPHAPRVIGSHCTGLVLAHSDLDFILPYEDPSRSLERDRRPSPTRPQIQDAHIRLLRQVQRALQHTDIFDNVKISDKRNPSLSARHRPTGLLLQFYCGEDIPAITEYLQDYQAEYPALRPLYAVTRTLLEARGLFGSSQASVGPDALAMLVVAFLKMNHGRFPGPNSLGDQFLALLQFYGTQVDLKSVGVAVDPPGLFSTDMLPVARGADETAHQRGQRSLINVKRTAAGKRNFLVAQRLCIQDPTHYMNDLGRSCTRTSELQSAFAAACQQLRDACDEWASDGNIKSSSVLATTLQANFDGLEKVRNQLAYL